MVSARVMPSTRYGLPGPQRRRKRGEIRLPLKQGFSQATIKANIAEMVRAGRSKDQAVAAAYETARKVFRKRNPGKPLPAHLRKKG